MPKAVIHTASGEFRDPQGRFLVEGASQGWTEAGCPAPADGAFSIVQIPAGVVPDQRTQKWNGSDVVAKTAAELAVTDQVTVDAMAAACPSPDVLALIACVAECCSISETDVRSRFARHLRRIHRKGKKL